MQYAINLTEQEIRALAAMAAHCLDDDAFDIEEWYAGLFSRDVATHAYKKLVTILGEE